MTLFGNINNIKSYQFYNKILGASIMQFGQSSSSSDSEVQSESALKFSEDFEEEFTFEKKEKRFQEMNFLMGCLKNHFIFYNLTEAQLENVAKKMYYCFVPCDSFIFKQKTKSNWFFIIEKGLMNATINGKIQKQLRVGDGFGQIALLYKTTRNFSVKACESCCLWAIDRGTFRKAVEQILIRELEQNIAFMKNIQFFNLLSNDHKAVVAGSLTTQNYVNGQMILNEGDPGSSFYIIKSGQATLWRGSTLTVRLGKTDCFGEQSLYYNTVRQLSIRAEGDVTCLVVSRQTLAKVLGDQIFVVTFQNFIKCSIQKSAHLSKLSKNEINKIVDMIKINQYKAGSVVIKKAKGNRLPHNQKIIVVIEGVIKKSKSIYPLAARSDIYGEQFLLETKIKGRHDDDIVMESNGVLGEIQVDLIKQMINGYIDTTIRRRQIMKQQRVQQNNQRRQKKMIKELNNFVVMKQLEGNFGTNLLVALSHSENNYQSCQYLLKCAEKSQVQNNLLYKYIKKQVNLQKTLHHPLIAEGYKAFQDEALFYSLVEFIQGEQLYEVMRKIGLLSSSDAQFYTACIIIIIEYLSENNAYLRDIKPQNFIVDMSGYPILVDLVSVKVDRQKSITHKTMTMIGTPHYMAPEIIMNKGYNFQASLYSLGVNIFQFLCGYVPFGEDSQDPLQIYEDVLNSQLKFPKNLKDNKAKKLIEQLLNKHHPENRLGGSNLTSLRNNSWFQNFSWDSLYAKNMEAPQFQRNSILKESQEQLLESIKNSQNCQQYLNEKYPRRFESSNFES